MHAIIAYALLVISILMQNTVSIGTETQQLTADLNGDGVEETITLEYMPDVGDYILTDGIANVEGHLEPYLLGMELVDIDTSDNQMESSVDTAGPSDDYESVYYTLINDRVQYIGHVYGYAHEQGNGDIYADAWMGFWSRTDIYRLDPSNITIEPVEQDMQTVKGYGDGEQVGVECTVTEPFPIYSYRDSDVVLANLEDGSGVTIIACHLSDPVFPTEDTYHDIHADWYMLRSEAGITGWAQLASFWDKVDGLMWAD
jgi:hypothetical protein